MNIQSLRPPSGQAAAIATSIASMVPKIETDRLVLRAPRLEDFQAYEVVFASDRARYIGGPYTPEAAFADFCQASAGWLLRGSGMWSICRKGTEAALGWIYLWHEFGDPEPEMGWVLTEAAEGHGYAAEAAAAALPHGLALYGVGGFVSYIDNGNDRSARLAERLGARRDQDAESALGAEGCRVYRHFGPEAS